MQMNLGMNFSLMTLVGATALGTTVALSMSGCDADKFTVGTDPDAGDGGVGGDSGVGGDGGTMYVPPTLSRPPDGLVVPRPYAFFSWADAPAPMGRTVMGHRVCWTTGDVSTLASCPNSALPAATRHVSAIPTAGITYFLNAQTCYDAALIDCSPFSPPRSFTSGPVSALYELEGTPADGSGNGRNGTLQNGATTLGTTGIVGQGLELDGVNDHMTVANDPAFNFGTGDFAISVWFLATATGNFQILMNKQSMTSGYAFYRRPPGTVAFTGFACSLETPAPVAEGVWQHAVVTRQGGTLRIYVNGELAASGPCSENLDSTATVAVGCDSPEVGCTGPFPGTLDQVGVYGSLTEEQIRQIFCSVMHLSGVDPLPAACQP
jgi:hypothetical protein